MVWPTFIGSFFCFSFRRSDFSVRISKINMLMERVDTVNLGFFLNDKNITKTEEKPEDTD